jgi:hypothetical protein
MADIKNVNSEEKALMGGKAWGRLDGETFWEKVGN